MTDDKLLIAAIEQHESQADRNGTVQEDRADALDYYLGKPLGNEVDGRSQVINRTVWDTVEWLKPQLADVFCSGEEIVSFAPLGPNDVQAAEQESDYVSHILTQKNNWFEVFYGWSHDALVQKNGYVKAYWDDSEDDTTEPYRNLTEDEYANLRLKNPDAVIDDVEEGEATDPLTGAPVVVYSCRVQRTKPRNVVKIENVVPSNVRISANARGLSLQDPRVDFVQHSEQKSLSELREMGFDVDDDLSDAGDSSQDWEDATRDDGNPLRNFSADPVGEDKSSRRVWVRETWIRYDRNGDGKAELLHCFKVGTKLLDCEETDHIGLVSLCPTPLPHQHHGLSVADAVMDLQRIQTALLRGALDNQYLANNGRYGVNLNTVNLDDMLDSRAGGIVRNDGPVNEAFMPLTHPTNGQVAIPMLEYVEKIAQRRTGISEMSQGLDPNALNNQAGAEANSRMMTAAQQRVKFIARVFAETGVKALFQLVHALTLKHSRQQDMVQMRGQWVPVDPRTWVKRNDLRINLTLGTGDKPQQIMMLQAIGMAQKEGLAIGIATPKNLHHTATKLTQLMGHRDSESFWTQPPDGPMQGPQDPKVTVEQMRQQADVQKFQAEAQMRQQTEAIEAAAKQREAELQLQLQASNDARDSERENLKAQYGQQLAVMQEQSKREIEAARLALEGQKLTIETTFAEWKAKLDAETTIAVEAMRQQGAERQAERQSMESAADREVKAAPAKESAKASSEQSSLVATAMAQLAEAIKNQSRPRKIVRGADGKVEGIE